MQFSHTYQAALMVARRSAGVALEVNLSNLSYTGEEA